MAPSSSIQRGRLGLCIQRCLLAVVTVAWLVLTSCASAPPSVSQPPSAPTATAARDQVSAAATYQPRTAAQVALGVYAPPLSCAVTPLVGPEPRRTFPAWWLEGEGITAGTPIGVLFQGGNKVQWQLTTDAALTVSGERLDGPAAPLEVASLHGIGNGSAVDHLYSSGIVFPEAGCWTMHAEAGRQRLAATVYIYPYRCKPLNMRDPQEPRTPIDCRAPA